MSLFAAFAGIGVAIGAGIGGLTLILYNYEVLGVILGSVGIIAAIIFKLVTVDPTRPAPARMKNYLGQRESP